MTNEEAIGFLQSRVDLIDKYYPDVKDYREALITAIKALEQKSCDDCISREETMQIIRAWFDRNAKPSELKNEIEQMPSVTPQPKIGRWMHPYKSDIACECSECHMQMPIANYFNYCPNCGSKMVEPQAESEDKE